MAVQSKLAALLTTLALALPLVAAHGHTVDWSFDGKPHPGWNPSYAGAYNGGVTAQRPSVNSDQGFTDYTSGIVACGGPDAGSGLETWDINAGSSVTVTWDTWPESHKGPVTEYMAYCGETCDGVAADSLDWFKIQEDGFDGTLWASEKIPGTKKWTFDIPAELAAGKVLIRHDILAMHTVGGPQVYPYCFQANLISDGTVKPTLTTTFPEAYTQNTDFLTWSIYNNDNAAFVAPGPAVYNAGGAAPAPAPAPTASTSETVVEPVPTTAEVPATTVEVPATTAEVPATSDVAVPSVTSDVAVPTSDVALPTSDVAAPSSVEPEYPVPSVSAPSASAPAMTAPAETSDVATPSSVEPEYPAPSVSAPSASAPAVTAPAETSAAVPAPVPTGGAEGGANLQTATGTVGGAAPGVYQSGEKFKTGANTFNFKQDALYRSCDEQRNACYDFANSQYGQTSTIQGQCETQASDCKSSISWSKRDVVAARWAKRGTSVY